MKQLKEGVKKICSLLNSHQVAYMIVGGFAVIHHGYPRSTADIDFWYAPTTENYLRLVSALETYGVDVSELKNLVFDPEKTFLRIPDLGFRTEFLPVIKGFKSFKEVKERAVQISLDDVPVLIISYDDLLKNKLTVGRAKDRLDVEELVKRKEAEK
jgi:predicted nucleotidyltransferase